MNVTHKPLDENTICFNQIVDRLSNYTPTNFQQLFPRKCPLIWEIDVVGKSSPKTVERTLVTSNDHNFCSAWQNPTFFGALESSRRGVPCHTTHSQFGHTTKERDHKNPHGLTTFKKRSFLNENVTSFMIVNLSRDIFGESKPTLTGHNNSELH
jgi:hypothetical protein